MTRLTTKLMIAAAALVAAGAASAQTMKADIPFAFQVSGKTMAAGTYQVDLRGNTGVVTVRSLSHGSAMAKPITHKDEGDNTAKLVFTCVRGNCALAEVWPGYSNNGLLFSTPKVDRREVASLAVIPLRRDAE